MREFKDITAFVTHMRGVQAQVSLAGTTGLATAAVIIEARAKEEVGTYQHGEGPFEDWAALADATREDRLRKGYAEDEPGLRSGEMRDSIGHEVAGHEAAIGSNDEHLIYFELGTRHQPPRSVLGLAAVHETTAAVNAMVRPVVTTLASVPRGTLLP